MKFLEKTNKEEFSVAIPSKLNFELCNHLIRADGQEDVAFALYHPSNGVFRFTALIYKVILPEDGDREVHGNVTIWPEFFKRICRIAAEEKCGIVLLHSHPSAGWQGMSLDDIKTEESYSEASFSINNFPIVGLTLGSDRAWSGRIWEYNNEWFERKSAATVRVVGKRLHVSYNDTIRPKPLFKNTYKRTVTVWGEKNHLHLARLRVGIIGLGSVGSMVAETLARIGVERFTLIDFDEVQEHNLDRLLGTTINDIGQPKVYVAQRQINKAGTGSNIVVRPVQNGITEEEGYRNALDCDVIFSCVDRPWPRFVLNHIAYNHLIPVIDGGIQVRLNTDSREFEGADWQLQVVGPDRPCLRCLGAYHAADVDTERAGQLDNPSYLAGLPSDHAFKRNENIFPFSSSLASLEVMQFIEMVTGMGGAEYYGTQRYSYNEGYIRLVSNITCVSNCLFTAGIGQGDSIYDPPIGFDHSAGKARERQK